MRQVLGEEVSERRASKVLGQPRRTQRYVARQDDDEPALVQRFLEDLLVERDFRQRVLKPAVFQFQFLEAFGRVGLHAAVLLTPAMERRLADAQLLAHLADGGPAVELGIGLTQLADDLFGGVLLAFHGEFVLALRAG